MGKPESHGMRMGDVRSGPPADVDGTEEEKEFLAAQRYIRDATDAKAFVSLRRRPGKKLRLVRPEEELSMSVLKARDRRQDIGLKRVLAYFAVGAVGVQLLVANWFFHTYLNRVDFVPSDAVMIAWLSASVVEVIGIVAIIARNLFPNRGALKKGTQKDGARGD
jgi:hypothetical protein